MNHLSDDQLKRYEARTLSATDLLEMDDHLHGCDRCYDRFRALVRPGDVFEFRTGAWEHGGPEDLLYRYLESYVDGRLRGQDLDRFESHLESCQSCASEAQALMEIRSHLLQGGEIASYKRAEPVTRWGSYLPRSGRARVAIAASAAVIAAAVLFTAFYEIASNRSSSLKSRIATLERENQELRQSSAEQNTLRAQLEALQLEHSKLQSLYDSEKKAFESVKKPPSGTGKPNVVESGIAVKIKDGQRDIEVGPAGQIRGIDHLTQSLNSLAGLALLSGRPVTLPQLRLNSQGPALMGPSTDESFELSGPLGSAVTSDRPEFKWQAMAGAAKYHITLRDSSTNQQQSGETSETHWSPPQPLARGRLYYWQVKTEKEGREILSPLPTRPPARFWVLTSKDLDRLALIKRSHADSHLVLGVVYAKLGLIDDAIAEFRILSSQNPGSKPIQEIVDYLGSLRR